MKDKFKATIPQRLTETKYPINSTLIEVPLKESKKSKGERGLTQDYDNYLPELFY